MLNTHKGTVIRARLKIANLDIVELNPLKQGLGGLACNPSSLRELLDIRSLTSKKTTDWILLDTAGNPKITLQKYAGNDQLRGVELLVVYPNGTVWEGTVGGAMKDVSLIAWSDPIIRSLKNKEQVLQFYQPSWEQTPTSIVVKSTGAKPECARIEHQCGQQCQ